MVTCSHRCTPLGAQATTPRWTPRSRRCSYPPTRESARGCCRWGVGGRAGAAGAGRWWGGRGKVVGGGGEGRWWGGGGKRHGHGPAHSSPMTVRSLSAWPTYMGAHASKDIGRGSRCTKGAVGCDALWVPAIASAKLDASASCCSTESQIQGARAGARDCDGQWLLAAVRCVETWTIILLACEAAGAELVSGHQLPC